MNFWQNEPAKSNGDQVYQWSGDNENESGLIFIEQLQSKDTPEHHPTLCVISAILYVAWQAYRFDGIEPPYASIANTDETLFGETLGYANRIAEVRLSMLRVSRGFSRSKSHGIH